MKELTKIMTIEVTSIGEIDDKTFERTFDSEEWKDDIAKTVMDAIRSRFDVDDIHAKVQIFVMDKEN